MRDYGNSGVFLSTEAVSAAVCRGEWLSDLPLPASGQPQGLQAQGLGAPGLPGEGDHLPPVSPHPAAGPARQVGYPVDNSLL